MNVEFAGHGDHSADALGGLLGGDELPIVGDVAGQGDGAVVCSDTNVRSINARVPAQLGRDQILQCRVCGLHVSPPVASIDDTTTLGRGLAAYGTAVGHLLMCHV